MNTGSEAPAIPIPRAAARARSHTFEQAAIFFMLTMLSAKIAVPLPPDGVPMTFQTLAVLLAALSVGAKPGMLAMAMYIAVGSLGAAVFAGPEAGAVAILGQTGGYLVGFFACQPVVAKIARDKQGAPRGWAAIALAVFVGTLVIYAIGVPWLAVVRGFSLARALEGGFYPFIPGAILKSLLAIVIAKRVAPYAVRRIW